MSGQSIADRITAAKYSISGQGLAKTVCKATTEELIAPKKKHVDYLIQCTNEPNVSIPQLANLLIERVHGQNWTIVFKSLVTIHNLINFGNERFTQYLASNNCSFQMDNFYDRTPMSVDMSKFIRRYSKYIHQKCYSYRIEAYDFCKVKRGKDDGVLRSMSGEKLLKTLPVLQQQLDALLDFDATVADLGNNSVIYACFILLFKDLIRLFACYNDGVINLLETYFEMNKKQCKEALDIYKKFLLGMDGVSTFLKTAENMGVDRGDIPDLAKAPASLLEALESHLASLEGKTTTPTGSKPLGFTNAVDNLSKNMNDGTGADIIAHGISEDERKKVLEEENQTLHLFNQKAASPVTAKASTNPFAAPAKPDANLPVNKQSKPIDDLLGLDTGPLPAANTNPFGGQPASNVDLFGVQQNAFSAPAQSPFNGNAFAPSGQSPFGDKAFTQPAMFGAQNNAAPSLFDAPAGQHSFAATNTTSTNPWNVAAAPQQTSPLHQQQRTPVDFSNVFGESQPTINANSGFDAFGPVMAPSNTGPQSAKPAAGKSKLLDKDLDSSLANLVVNLGIGSGGNQVKKEHEWSSSPNRGLLTGGANWTGASQAKAPSTLGWNHPQQASMQPMAGQRQPSPMGQASNIMNPFQQPQLTQKTSPALDPFDSLLN